MAKLTYSQMVEQALGSAPRGKFMSRNAIKAFMQQNFSVVSSASTKLALKNALAKFERKGDSFRISQEMKQAAQAKVKAASQKSKAAERKKAAMEKRKVQKAAQAAKKSERLAKQKNAKVAKKQQPKA